MSKSWPLSLLLLFGAVLTDAQQTLPDGCALSLLESGQLTSLHGKVVNAPHDMILRVPNCESVVLVYSGEPDASVSAPNLPAPSRPKLRRDYSFKKFDKYVRAEQRHLFGGGICIGCSKYEVEATFAGILEIAHVPDGLTRDTSGFLRDASGKVVGTAGFGHPGPFYKYRLVIESVSDVVGRRLPGRSQTNVLSGP